MTIELASIIFVLAWAILGFVFFVTKSYKIKTTSKLIQVVILCGPAIWLTAGLYLVFESVMKIKRIININKRLDNWLAR